MPVAAVWPDFRVPSQSIIRDAALPRLVHSNVDKVASERDAAIGSRRPRHLGSAERRQVAGSCASYGEMPILAKSI